MYMYGSLQREKQIGQWEQNVCTCLSTRANFSSLGYTFVKGRSKKVGKYIHFQEKYGQKEMKYQLEQV